MIENKSKIGRYLSKKPFLKEIFLVFLESLEVMESKGFSPLLSELISSTGGMAVVGVGVEGLFGEGGGDFAAKGRGGSIVRKVELVFLELH